MVENGTAKPKKGAWQALKHGRVLSQALFLGLTVWIAVRMAGGARGADIERYCPFGGVETLLPWLRKTGTLCSLSTLNLSILFGLLLMTLLFKRVFCSHICPMGAVLEWVGAAGRKVAVGKKRLPRSLDRPLTWLKYPLAGLIVALTVKYGELVFRGFDPYYVLFTAGRGHGIGTWGLGVTLVILLAGVLVPLSFCRYLCPLGACLAPVGRAGILRIHRNEETCTHCGACDAACAWGVTVSEARAVTGAECSNCQDCVRSCPAPGTLTLGVGRAKP